MFQAITTKFLPCTNSRGSRVKATAQAGSVTISWDHAHNPEHNHTLAARVLASKLKWHGAWIGGALPASSGYCFVHGDDGFTVAGKVS